MSKVNSLTIERLRECLSYDSNTGVFTWLLSGAGWVRPGDVAGWESHGYRRIHIDKKYYYAHRIAWFYIHGEWPKEQIDHIDGDRCNNRIVNLRAATNSENAYNKKMTRRNTSGHKGVYFHKAAKKWTAMIRSKSGHIYLGLYKTKELAHAAYADAAMKYHGEFARTE